MSPQGTNPPQSSKLLKDPTMASAQLRTVQDSTKTSSSSSALLDSSTSGLSACALQMVADYRFVITPYQWQRLLSDPSGPGGIKVYYITPSGRVLRSESELRQYLQDSSATDSTICRCYIPSLPFDDVFCFEPTVGSISLPKPKPATKVVLSPCTEMLTSNLNHNRRNAANRRGNNQLPQQLQLSIDGTKRKFFASLSAKTVLQDDLGVDFPCLLTKSGAVYTRALSDINWKHLACEYRHEQVHCQVDPLSSLPSRVLPEEEEEEVEVSKHQPQSLQHQQLLESAEESGDEVEIDEDQIVQNPAIIMGQPQPATVLPTLVNSNSLLIIPPPPVSIQNIDPASSVGASQHLPTNSMSDDDDYDFNLQAAMMVSVQLTEDGDQSPAKRPNFNTSYDLTPSPTRSSARSLRGTSLLATPSAGSSLLTNSLKQPSRQSALTRGRNQPTSPIMKQNTATKPPRRSQPPSPALNTFQPSNFQNGDTESFGDDSARSSSQNVQRPLPRRSRVQQIVPQLQHQPESMSDYFQQEQPPELTSDQESANLAQNEFDENLPLAFQQQYNLDSLPVGMPDGGEEFETLALKLQPKRKKQQQQPTVGHPNQKKPKATKSMLSPVRILRDKPLQQPSTTTSPATPKRSPQSRSALQATNGVWKCNYPHCSRTFDQRSNLAAHARIHRRVKPYRCTWMNEDGTECGYASEFRNNTTRHVREIHFGVSARYNRGNPTAPDTRSPNDYIEHVKEDGSAMTAEEERQDQLANQQRQQQQQQLILKEEDQQQSQPQQIMC